MLGFLLAVVEETEKNNDHIILSIASKPNAFPLHNAINTKGRISITGIIINHLLLGKLY